MEIVRREKEDAVSPIIGTILLVAITVILAAVIAAVVLGFAGNENPIKVGIHALEATGSNATVILYGGESLSEIVKLEMIDMGSPKGELVKFWEKSGSEEQVTTGYPYLVKNVSRPPDGFTGDVYQTRINVVGTFVDGTTQIILVQPLTFSGLENSGGSIVQPTVGFTVEVTEVLGKFTDFGGGGINGICTDTFTGEGRGNVEIKLYLKDGTYIDFGTARPLSDGTWTLNGQDSRLTSGTEVYVTASAGKDTARYDFTIP